MKDKQAEKSKKAPGRATQGHWHEMNRKQRREMMRKIQSDDLRLEVVHPNAAGIDIGNESHYVAVPPTRDSESVRRFGCTTAELKEMADWLKQCGIRTVAMQSTGVYWIAVYDILEEVGMEVYLANARETKNLPGRKKRRAGESMADEAAHARAAAKFLPAVAGDPGAIIEAILGGERDPQKLAEFRDARVKASKQEIARSPEGHWQEDLLFVLRQEQDGYEFCQKQMAECDQRIEQYLQQREDRSAGASLPEEKRKERLRKKKKGNTPQFDLRTELFRMTGADLTQIDGVDVMTAMTILSEVGWDMSKWRTEHHFVSWLRLCPDNKISGDKIIGKGRLPTTNRATSALRMAASTLRVSNTYLGAQFRRLRTKLGAPIAIKAMGAKLARLVYRVLRYGMTFVDKGAEFCEAQHRTEQIRYLKWRAAKMGLQIIEAPAA
jgi:transposase